MPAAHDRPRRHARAAFRAMLAVALAAGTAAVPASAVSTTLVVSQVYGGGGNSGATLRNDFVELYNRGTTTVTVTGWSVQYAAASGTTWAVVPLSGSVPPGGYYLVQLGAGGSGTTDLPAPDATGTVNIGATAGKLALAASTVALNGACPTVRVDLVGYGSTATCAEGTPAPAPSTTTAILRRSGGGTDTDANAADFTVGSPTPRNSVNGDVTAPAVTAPAASLTSGTTLSGSALAGRLAWSGADEAGGTGLARFDLVRSTNGAAATTILTGLATSTVSTFPTGGTLLHGVRAVDKAGNASAFAYAAPLRPVLHQEGSAAIVYAGSWSSASGSTYSGGGARTSGTAGASATYAFTGRSVALVTTLGPGRGAVQVWVDGALATTVDTYARKARGQVQVWSTSWATEGPHTVRFVVVGTAGRPRVDLDAVGSLDGAPTGTVSAAPLVLLGLLAVTAEAPDGYLRDLFVHWIDADGDGCDTRREVLVDEALAAVTVGAGCTIAGGSWYSAYDGVTTVDAAALQIDHVVALKEAWDSGAHAWGSDRGRSFANDLGDPRSLRAVTGTVNGAKSDLDPAQWLPPLVAFRCQYATEWVAVKVRWRLAVDATERTALSNLLAGCPATAVTVAIVP